MKRKTDITYAITLVTAGLLIIGIADSISAMGISNPALGAETNTDASSKFFEFEQMQIVGARSYADHGSAGILYIDLMAGLNPVEPRFRNKLLYTFEFDLREPVFNIGSPDGTATLVDSDTVRLVLIFPPSDESWYTITLTSGGSDVTFTMGFLEGDVNQDMKVNPVDNNQLLLRFGKTPSNNIPLGPSECEPQWDVNCDGAVNPVDTSQTILRFGNSLP